MRKILSFLAVGYVAVNEMPHRSIGELWKGQSAKTKTSSDANGNNGRNGENVPQAEESRLRLVEPNASEEGMWRTAWERAKKESKWEPPPQWGLDDLNHHDEVQVMRHQAHERANEAQKGQHKIIGTNLSLRDLYGNIAKWAEKFQAIGDIVSQAVPGYGTIPWVSTSNTEILKSL